MGKRTRQEKEELKQKIMAAHLNGISVEAFCKHNNIPRSTYYHYVDVLSGEIRREYIAKRDRLIGYFFLSAMDRISEMKRLYAYSRARAARREQEIKDKIPAMFGIPEDMLPKNENPKQVIMRGGIPEIVKRLDEITQPDFALLDRIHKEEMDLFDRLQSIGAIPKAENKGVVVDEAKPKSPIEQMIADARRKVKEERQNSESTQSHDSPQDATAA